MPTVLITGAKRGIGRGLVDRFLEQGWDVLAAGRDASSSPLAELDRVRTVDFDVTDEASIKTAAASLIGVPIDLLINNAGVFDADYSNLADVSVEQWQRDFAVNTMGPVLVARAFLPNLRAGGRKQLAVISSTMASMGKNAMGFHYSYRSTKAGVNAAWVSLSLDLADDDFTCVVLCPGWVRTDMGGPSAALSVEESTGGLFKVLNGLTAADNGRFINYAGEEVAW
ncbi:MAG: SDR family oxidoreductase [Alphaproteobacteria bacterium]|nr:SDR family oxidoreductase [Alphaproteobacteria bacterium SS10]